MPSITKGVGSFTADNIVSILRALPETNGTYAQVIARAAEHGAQLSATTLGKWVTTGRADIETGIPSGGIGTGTGTGIPSGGGSSISIGCFSNAIRSRAASSNTNLTQLRASRRSSAAALAINSCSVAVMCPGIRWFCFSYTIFHPIQKGYARLR